MLNITLTIQYTDGREAKVKAGPATQVAFEREHDVGIIEIASSKKLSNLYWVAWHASKTDVGFDTWLEAVDSIDVEVGAANPTKPAPPAD